jgi:hypothetical protein
MLALTVREKGGSITPVDLITYRCDQVSCGRSKRAVQNVNGDGICIFTRREIKTANTRINAVDWHAAIYILPIGVPFLNISELKTRS